MLCSEKKKRIISSFKLRSIRTVLELFLVEKDEIFSERGIAKNGDS